MPGGHLLIRPAPQRRVVDGPHLMESPKLPGDVNETGATCPRQIQPHPRGSVVGALTHLTGPQGRTSPGIPSGRRFAVSPHHEPSPPPEGLPRCPGTSDRLRWLRGCGLEEADLTGNSHHTPNFGSVVPSRRLAAIRALVVSFRCHAPFLGDHRKAAPLRVAITSAEGLPGKTNRSRSSP